MDDRTLHVATQCRTASIHRYEVGSYLYDKTVGIGTPVSPVFGGLIELFDWCRNTGWKMVRDGTLDPGYRLGADPQSRH